MTTDTPDGRAQPRERAAALDCFAWVVALLLVALHVGMAWLARAPALLGDEAVYVALARSLRDFEDPLYDIGQPLHRMYPPGFPLALAIWSAIGGERFDWLVVVSIASSGAALLLIFAVLRRRWESRVALACLAAMACNSALISSAGRVMSEAVFMLCTAAALWAASHERDTRRDAITAGVMALVAASTRTIGVTLLAALVFHWMRMRRYGRAAVLSLASATLVGSWIVFTALAPTQVPGASYVADAAVRPPDASLGSAVVGRIGSNVLSLVSLYAMVTPSVAGTPIDNAIGGIVIGAGWLAGLYACWRRWPAAATYLAAYLSLLLLWPWLPARFLVPVLPWLIAAVIVGVHDIAAPFRPSLRIVLTAALLGVMAVTGLARASVLVRERANCDRTAMPAGSCGGEPFERVRYYFAVVQRVRALSEPDARLVSPYPATMFLFTGRLAVPMPEALSQQPSEFIDFLRARGAAYVVLTDLTAFTEGKPRLGGTPLAVMVRDNCHAFRLEASFGASAYLFRLAGPASKSTSTPACQAADDFIARFGTEWR